MLNSKDYVASSSTSRDMHDVSLTAMFVIEKACPQLLPPFVLRWLCLISGACPKGRVVTLKIPPMKLRLW